MNQRIAVRALVRKDDKTLLLRRANGRPSILGQYELPGGKMEYGEQPEDALRRYLHDDAGVHIQTAQLFDVVTYIDHDDRDIQYAVIVYTVGLAEGHHDIHLGSNYNRYEWSKLSELQHIEITDLTELLLGIVQQEKLVESSKKVVAEKTITADTDTVTIYSDGGSRGNPGPSACGYVIMNAKQEVIGQGGEYLGITTNSQAEYHGVRLGLEKALALGLKDVRFCIDSMLVVNQMNGIYNIKNRELWPINERIRQLVTQFHKVSFTHVGRDLNQYADGMVNKILNAHQRE